MNLIASTAAGKSIHVRLIHVWERSDPPAPTEAPTFRNMAAALFVTDPAITRVALLVTSAPCLLFVAGFANGQWCDVTGAEVKIRKEVS